MRERVWLRPHRPLGRADRAALKADVAAMFDHAYGGYMAHAFPRDNLLAASCRGADWQGGMALTLIDALGALVLLGRGDDALEAARLLPRAVSFDLDADVHVFEVTIRALGGLLSAHVLLARAANSSSASSASAAPSAPPRYDGALLAMAADLGARLLPAFDGAGRAATGLPATFVNLRTGATRANDTATCTACAGTLLLEFGLLSALTGDARFEAAARRAAAAIYARRSPLGLVGSALHAASGAWVAPEATVGPLADSYYEYLLKAWLLRGDDGALGMFADLYAAAMARMTLPEPVGGDLRASFLVRRRLRGRVAGGGSEEENAPLLRTCPCLARNTGPPL